LRTPLVTGLGYIELLLEGHLGPASSEAVSGMRVALRNLRRLSSLIDDILSYHSLIRQDQKGGPIISIFSAASLLRECREEFLVRSGHPADKVEMKVADQSLLVSADEDMIRRVISNLLDNAHRHAGDHAHIRMSARADGGGMVRFAVADDGPGMEVQARDRVFEPFVKLSGRQAGAGLGLAIIRTVLDAHGSEPVLVSAPGEGTEICFRLPGVNSSCVPDRRKSDRFVFDGARGDGFSVLVVDDDEDTLELVKRILVQRGYDVQFCSDAESGLRLLAGYRPDLVLLDMTLPGMDGVEMCARIKAEPATANVPVLMFTARAEDSARERARNAGCDGYVTKPIVMREFAMIIRQALEASK
jgi:CheY-like chemotaxis protein/two-component sensor histidine kinase